MGKLIYYKFDNYNKLSYPSFSSKHSIFRTKTLIPRLTSLFRLDYRSLALLRIGLGVLIFVDLLIRSTDLTAHYTDKGVLPRSALLSEFLHSDWIFSIHLLSGKEHFQALLFAIAGIFALGMAIGYRTRFCVIASWIFLISIQSRNPMVLQGGDGVFRLLVFWAMFLPLGERWSIDSWLKGSKTTEPSTSSAHCSMACVGLLAQLCIVYMVDATLKTDAIWKSDFTALYYTLSIDQFATPLGSYLVQFTSLTKLLTAITILLQAFGFFLLLIPYFKHWFRLAAIVLYCGFHLGTAVTMELGLFPYICCVGWLVVFPTKIWDWLEPKIHAIKPNQRFWQGLENWATKYQLKERLAPTPRTKRLEPLFPGAGKWIFRSQQAVLTLLIAYTVLWNLREIDYDKHVKRLPASTDWIGWVLRLDQRWDMFAPRPMVDDGWYVIAAQRISGEEVDLFTQCQPTTYDKPAVVSKTYKNQRWRKYLMNLWMSSNERHRLYFGQYLTRGWNSQLSGSKQIKTFQIVFMKEVTPPLGQPMPEPEKVVIWNHRCFDETEAETEVEKQKPETTEIAAN